MSEIENLCFELISAAGSARSSYIEAIQAASEGNFADALESIAQGETEFLSGHTAHAKILSEQAKGNKDLNSMLLMHAEDLMMSAENFGIIAKNDVHMYEQFYDLKNLVESK